MTSAPEGATLTVGGVSVGKAPYETEAPPGTMLEVTASLDGYLKTMRFIEVGTSSSVETVKLSPEVDAEVGIVKITSEPWAYLAVDGRVLGNVLGAEPVELELPPGEHVLSADNPVVEWSEQRVVVVKAGKTLEVRFEKQ